MELIVVYGKQSTKGQKGREKEKEIKEEDKFKFFTF